jgi:hypothetical protein
VPHLHCRTSCLAASQNLTILWPATTLRDGGTQHSGKPATLSWRPVSTSKFPFAFAHPDFMKRCTLKEASACELPVLITAGFKKHRRSNCAMRSPACSVVLVDMGQPKERTAHACKTCDSRRFVHFRYKRGRGFICRSPACHWRAIAHSESPKGRCCLSCCWGWRPERRRFHATEGEAHRSAQRGRSGSAEITEGDKIILHPVIFSVYQRPLSPPFSRWVGEEGLGEQVFERAWQRPCEAVAGVGGSGGLDFVALLLAGGWGVRLSLSHARRRGCSVELRRARAAVQKASR